MLLVVYLEYLDLLFNIEKLMHSLTGRDDSALINTAVSLLNTTVSSVQHFSRNSGAYVDYVWSVSKSISLSNPGLSSSQWI